MSDSSTHAQPRSRLGLLASSLIQWFDSDHVPEGREVAMNQPDKVDWVRTIPFVFLHAGCLGIIWVGWSPVAAWTAAALYFIRMFAVTGIYHRYFSHKTYRTTRFGQFLLALLGATAVQRGALWWAYHHRDHHKHSDGPEDVHSPHVHGFWWSHIGWITSRRNFPTDYSKIPDLAKFPELVFLNRFDWVVPVILAAALFGMGALLESVAPSLGTSAGQMLVWGFFVSTTFLFHGTSCINSMAHLMGRRRFKTDDDSRNSLILAIITLGEGWHNNHHRYQSATRNGFYWWEIDITYYMLKALSWTGFIKGLKSVPQSIYEEAANAHHNETVAAAQKAFQNAANEFHTLRKVVPTAAAFALASMPVVAAPAKDSKPESAIHKDVATLDLGSAPNPDEIKK